MIIKYQHNLGFEEAYKRLNFYLDGFKERHKHEMRNYNTIIAKDKKSITFYVEAHGFNLEGTAHLTGDEVRLDSKLPLMVRPFNKIVRSIITSKLEKILS